MKSDNSDSWLSQKFKHCFLLEALRRARTLVTAAHNFTVPSFDVNVAKQSSLIDSRTSQEARGHLWVLQVGYIHMRPNIGAVNCTVARATKCFGGPQHRSPQRLTSPAMYTAQRIIIIIIITARITRHTQLFFIDFSNFEASLGIMVTEG